MTLFLDPGSWHWNPNQKYHQSKHPLYPNSIPRPDKFAVQTCASYFGGAGLHSPIGEAGTLLRVRSLLLLLLSRIVLDCPPREVVQGMGTETDGISVPSQTQFSPILPRSAPTLKRHTCDWRWTIASQSFMQCWVSTEWRTYSRAYSQHVEPAVHTYYWREGLQDGTLIIVYLFARSLGQATEEEFSFMLC